MPFNMQFQMHIFFLSKSFNKIKIFNKNRLYLLSKSTINTKKIDLQVYIHSRNLMLFYSFIFTILFIFV